MESLVCLFRSDGSYPWESHRPTTRSRCNPSFDSCHGASLAGLGGRMYHPIDGQDRTTNLRTLSSIHHLLAVLTEQCPALPRACCKKLPVCPVTRSGPWQATLIREKYSACSGSFRRSKRTAAIPFLPLSS